MKTKEVIDWLDATFHPEYQEDYDNAGFLLGNAQSDYKGALVALDLTPAVVDEAVQLGMSLIVTHHPFIFTGVKRLTDASETGRMTMALIKNDISVYAAHTNLDNLAWGVSGELATRLGLLNCRVLRSTPSPLRGTPPETGGEQKKTEPVVTCCPPETVEDPKTSEVVVACCSPETVELSEGLRGGYPKEIGAGMVGELPEPISVVDFLQKVKTVLGLPVIRVNNEACRVTPLQVQRVALCGGSGAEFIDDARAAGADIYLTADLKYHDFQRTDGRMVLADIGHYESEQFAKDIIFRCISEKFTNFACRISSTQKSLVQYI